MKKLFFLFVVLPCVAVAGEIAVTSVAAQQRYPSNGLVDITVTFQGAAEDVRATECVFAATNCATKTSIPIVHVTRNGDDASSGSIWTRKFIWEAAVDVGMEKVDDVELTVNVELLHGGVQLWEGGPYWAECNVGAAKPEEYGYYFWWGDTVGYLRNGNSWDAVDGTRTGFSFLSENCPTEGRDGSQLLSDGYIDSSGKLVAAHDAATMRLGTPWRMPTVEDFGALTSNCTTAWTTCNGVNGRIVTGKGAYSTQSIFLPAAGYGYAGADPYLQGFDGFYWASSQYPDNSGAYCLNILSSDLYCRATHRYYGHSVRALRAFDSARIATKTATTHVALDNGFKIAVRSVAAQQRNLRGCLVDITVTLIGEAEDIAKGECKFSATNSKNGAAISVVHLVQDGADVGSGLIWTRKFVWDAAKDIGEVKIEDVALTVKAEIPMGGVQLWENGPYWAECNVGATKPEESGYYFWWGDTMGYVRSGGVWTIDSMGLGDYYSDVTWVSSRGAIESCSPFTQSACPIYGKNVSQLLATGYIGSGGDLMPEHDAATAHLKSTWRMPTDAEFLSLVSNCTTMWTTSNGVYGLLVTGSGDYASNSIFLPAAGYGNESCLRSFGSEGYYWSSTPNSDLSIAAWHISFDSSDFYRSYFYRFFGQPVRPVREFSQSDVTVGGVVAHFSLDNRAHVVQYVDESGKIQECRNFEIVDNNTTVLTNGFYALWIPYVELTNVVVNGDVKLILGDECVLSVEGTPNHAAISVCKGKSLTVFGQGIGSGELICVGGENSAGIGGDSGKSCGKVAIFGGKIQAQGGKYGAGIGGGEYNGAGGTVTIGGGKVVARGGEEGAGIGSGYFSDPICNGGTLDVLGGDVEAYGGKKAAGIGGGYCCNGAAVRVRGGTVWAVGGEGPASGIGGGYYHSDNHGSLTVSSNLTVRSGVKSDGMSIMVPDSKGVITINGMPYYSIKAKVPSDDDEVVPEIEWAYTIQNGEAIIVNGESSAISIYTVGDVVVPSILGGCPVTKIGGNAFSKCSNLTSITIPEGVREIGEYAFSGCKNVRTIKIPDTVSRIGTYAFLNCQSLTSVEIPSGVVELEDRLFSNCYGLLSVSLPKGLKRIGENVFDCCGLVDLEIPNGVESIGYMAFARTQFDEIVIPNSVTNMGWGTFYAANARSVILSKNLHEISDNMFWNADGIEEVTLPSCVTNIGGSAFYSCDSLKIVRIVACAGYDETVLAELKMMLKDSGVDLDKVEIVVVGVCTASTFYVDSAKGRDSYSGLSADDAKKTIQAAVDVAQDGDTILVAAGMYAPFASKNKSVVIQSASGATATFIDGTDALRPRVEMLDDTDSTFISVNNKTNTVLVGFTVEHCELIIGGTIQRCVIRNIDASAGGAPINFSIVDNALILNNVGCNGGAGDNCIFRNCTIVGNRATSGYRCVALNCVLENCIVYGNADNSSGNWPEWLRPMISDVGYREATVFRDDPLFVDASGGDYRLSKNSPCIDAGDNAYVTSETDLTGKARIANGRVDIGCYEKPVECGLTISYYDGHGGFNFDETSYETFRQYFSSRLPTLTTNTLDVGETLDFGYHWDGDRISRFHGKYSDSGTDNFYVWMSGSFWAEKDGEYEFGFKADDGVCIFVDGQMVVGSKDSSRWTLRTECIQLDAGWHLIEIAYIEWSGPQGLSLYLKQPNERECALFRQTVLSPEKHTCNLSIIGIDGKSSTMIVERGRKVSIAAPEPLMEMDGKKKIIALGSSYTAPVVTDCFDVFVTNDMTVAWDVLATNYWFVTTAAVHGGIDAPSNGWKVEGAALALTAMPDEHYHLVRWTGDVDGCVASGNTLSVVMDRPRTIGAEFAIDEFKVTFDLSDKGVRVGGGGLEQTVAYGCAAVAPQLEANYGWTFLGWDGDFSCIVDNLRVSALWKEVWFEEKVGDLTWGYLLKDGVAVVENNGRAAVVGKVVGELIVPATLGGHPVRAIGAGAFSGCGDVETIVLPQNLVEVGEGAFAGCSNLVSVVLPEGVTAIAPRTFAGCAALEELVIPAGVQTIGEEAFAGCASLKAVEIPEGVTEISARTFAGCEKLSSVKLPESLERIDAEAFVGCAALGSVTIPANVSEIGENAFGDCKGLGSVRFYGQPPTGIWTSGIVNEKVTIHGPADVTISPADRTVFGTDLAVTLTTSWAGGVVRYTLDGSAPTAESPAFDGITVHNKTTVRAATFVEGLRWSEIEEATYGVGKVATPTASSTQGGTFYHNGNRVSLDCATAGVEIRYTFGGEPTTNSALYTGPFEISRTTTVKAKAFGHPDYVDSDVMTAEFVRAWEGLATPAISPEGGLIEAECELVTITCESEDVTIYYTLDGSRPSATNGRVYTGPFKLYQSATVKAIATKFDWADSEVASVTFTRVDQLGEALNTFGAKVTNDANAPWTVDTAESHDGVSAVRSAAVEGGLSGIKLTVKGAGRLSFWWKASCEEVWDGEYYDYGSFKVGSEEKAKIAGQTDWQRVVMDFETTGKHTLHWDYVKDDDNDEGKDCIWVDQVVWIPADGSGVTLTTGVPVPYAWLEGYGLGVTTDFETAANAKTGKRSAFGKELTVWEDYVTGTNPTNLDSVFRTFIDMSSGVPKISWEPDLNENGTKHERIYQIWGARSLDGQWFKVNGDEGAYNFFKTTVGLP